MGQSQTAMVKPMSKAPKPKPKLPGPVAKGFRPSDVRRVEGTFLEAMPEEYGVEVELSKDRKHLQVVVMDPDNPAIYVANAQFDFVEEPLKKRGIIPEQPPQEDVLRMAADFAHICTDYPKAKARQEAEQLFKASFAERKQDAIEQEVFAAQAKVEEEEQRARDRLLAKADADEKAALEDEAAP